MVNKLFNREAIPKSPIKYKDEWIDSGNRIIGWDGQPEMELVVNDLGWRYTEPDEYDLVVATVGCSHAMGQFVEEHQTFAYQLCKKIERKYNASVFNLNMSMVGMSNDFISRHAVLLAEDIKPDIVVIMFTFPARREYVHPTEDRICTFGGWYHLGWENVWNYKSDPKLEIAQGLSHDIKNWRANAYNFTKNYKLIEYAMAYHDINWIYSCLPGFDYFDNFPFVRRDNHFGHFWDDKARDNDHPGPESHAKIAQSSFEVIEKLGYVQLEE